MSANMVFPYQTSNQALVAPSKVGQAANSKGQEFKPRLLLMGLRR